MMILNVYSSIYTAIAHLLWYIVYRLGIPIVGNTYSRYTL